MNFDLHVWRFDWAPPGQKFGPGVADLARRGEAVGVRTLSFMDHYFQMEHSAPADDPMLELYTALGYVAGCTDRLRLRGLVTGVTYRHPGLLAKVVTTLDVLSGGRAELGIGAAWYQREHRALGVPFPPLAERFERLEEAIQICLQMWSDDDGPYAGRYYQLAETLCRPQPVSEPRPRIVIGGRGGPKMMRLLARYGDAANLVGPADAQAVRVLVDRLRRQCDDEGRDINEIEITTGGRNFYSANPTSDGVRRAAEILAPEGVSTIVISSDGEDPAARLEDVFAPVIREVAAMEPARL
jgi:F420-dependent oxidoreductase-like protein